MDTHKLVILTILTYLAFSIGYFSIQGTSPQDLGTKILSPIVSINTDKATFTTSTDTAFNPQSETQTDTGAAGFNFISVLSLIVGMLAYLVAGPYIVTYNLIAYTVSGANIVYKFLAFALILYFIILHLFLYLEIDAIMRRKKAS